MASTAKKNKISSSVNTSERAREKDRKSWKARVDLPVEDSDPGEPGSIEQQLDMVEKTDGPRGDDVLHSKGKSFDDVLDPNQEEEMDEDQMLKNYHVDMSDSHREGDEMSGDEHSLGLQGGDSELEDQPSSPDGLPGEETQDENDRAKHRMGEL